MKAWWQGLNARERGVLAAGAALVLVLLLYTQVWEPFHQRFERLRATVAEGRQDLAWMRRAALELERLDRGNSPAQPRPADGRSLLTLVDQTARTAGLGAAVKRVEPQGSDQVRMRLEQVSFDELIRWLGSLEQEHGVQAVNAIVDRQAEGGRVDARLVLQGRSS